MSKSELDFYEIFSTKNFFSFILDNIIINFFKTDFEELPVL